MLWAVDGGGCPEGLGGDVTVLLSTRHYSDSLARFSSHILVPISLTLSHMFVQCLLDTFPLAALTPAPPCPP
ncbi:unnamed protein product [Peniophora sp. CBMAI 1063]|nr:unnamed protein product [Peniophora sp. CBMAI 1063]